MFPYKWKLHTAPSTAETFICICNINIAAWKDRGAGEDLHQCIGVGLKVSTFNQDRKSAFA
jgi:hypothetical protein